MFQTDSKVFDLVPSIVSLQNVGSALSLKVPIVVDTKINLTGLGLHASDMKVMAFGLLHIPIKNLLHRVLSSAYHDKAATKAPNDANLTSNVTKGNQSNVVNSSDNSMADQAKVVGHITNFQESDRIGSTSPDCEGKSVKLSVDAKACQVSLHVPDCDVTSKVTDKLPGMKIMQTPLKSLLVHDVVSDNPHMHDAVKVKQPSIEVGHLNGPESSTLSSMTALLLMRLTTVLQSKETGAMAKHIDVGNNPTSDTSVLKHLVIRTCSQQDLMVRQTVIPLTILNVAPNFPKIVDFKTDVRIKITQMGMDVELVVVVKESNKPTAEQVRPALRHCAQLSPVIDVKILAKAQAGNVHFHPRNPAFKLRWLVGGWFWVACLLFEKRSYAARSCCVVFDSWYYYVGCDYDVCSSYVACWSG